jgi:hypothetical protein
MAGTALRWNGLLLTAGAVLFGAAVVRVSFNPVVNQQFTPGISLFFLLSSILLLLSLPRMYARQANAAGWLGIAFTLGLLLTGIATVQARVFPRWAGITLLVAMAGFFFVFFVAEFLAPMAGQVGSAFFAVLLALALSWIGLWLWCSRASALAP